MDTAKEYLPEEGLTKQKQPQISRSGSMKLSELKKAQQQGYRGSRSSQSLGSPAGGSQRAIYMAQSLDSSAMTQSMERKVKVTPKTIIDHEECLRAAKRFLVPGLQSVSCLMENPRTNQMKNPRRPKNKKKRASQNPGLR